MAQGALNLAQLTLCQGHPLGIQQDMPVAPQQLLAQVVIIPQLTLAKEQAQAPRQAPV